MAHKELPPLSPLSQYINTSTLTFYIIGVLELEIPLNKPRTIEFLRDGFVPASTRFSSIIVTDEKGEQRWKKVDDFMIEDHVIVPTFSSGLSSDDYELQLEEYISKIAMEQLPESFPPWQVHLIMYPTCNAAGTLVFKLNHAIGDGYSLMAGLFSFVKRADNPSLPLTFPSSSSRLNARRVSNFSRLSFFLSKCLNTVSDFTKNMLHGIDDETAIRSGRPRVEFEPVTISSVTFSLDHIRVIKSKVGGTVNDVTTGLISYALELYKKRMGHVSDHTRTTAMIALNMRMLRGFQNVEEMLRAKIWGNHFAFLHVSLPSFSAVENVDPLEFIVKAKEEMKRKTNSLADYFTSKLLNMLKIIRGPEAAAKYIHSDLKNASIMISNMIGPMEKVTLAGHPINNFYFTVPGVPQSLVFTIVSYMGKLRLVATAEKGFINSELLVSCLNEAFEKIYEAVGREDPMKSKL